VAVVQYIFTHKQYTQQHKEKTILEECGLCPVFASFTLAFALQLMKKHRKTSVGGKKNLSQSTVYILPKHPHVLKPTHTNTHTLQNNIKPPQYKLKKKHSTRYTQIKESQCNPNARSIKSP